MAEFIPAADVRLENLEKILGDLDDDKMGSLANSPLAHGMAIYMFRHLHESGINLNKEEFWTGFQKQFTGFPELKGEFEKAWAYLETNLL